MADNSMELVSLSSNKDDFKEARPLKIMYSIHDNMAIRLETTLN